MIFVWMIVTFGFTVFALIVVNFLFSYFEGPLDLFPVLIYLSSMCDYYD